VASPGLGKLCLADADDRPGRIRGDQVGEIDQRGRCGGHAERAAQHELEVQRRPQEPWLEVTQARRDHAGVEILELELDAGFERSPGKRVEELRRVEEHSHRRVDRAGVERGQLRTKLKRCQAFAERKVATRDAARRQAEDRVGLGAQAVRDHPQELHVLRTHAGLRTAHVHMQHRRSRLPGIYPGPRDLVGGDGDARRHLP